MKRRPSILLLLLLFAVGVFYGTVAEQRGLFPADELYSAREGAQALLTILSMDEDESEYRIPARRDGSGVVRHDPDRTQPGATFMTRFADHGFEAVIVNAAGEVLHRWHVPFSEVWPDADHLMYQAPDLSVSIHGAHLFPDGDVVWTYESGNFPEGGGLVRVDRCSNVKWALPRNTHHSVFLTDTGTLLVSAHHWREEKAAAHHPLEPPYLDDVVLEVSGDGEVIREASGLDLMGPSGRIAAVLLNNNSVSLQRDTDPLHQNDAEKLAAEMAAAFPVFEAGDLLVSYRDISTIAVLDPDATRIKWAMTGPFLRQHDPDFLPNGHILVFDNLGDRRDGKTRGSRVLEIDPSSQEVVWSYKGSDADPFFTLYRGKQQRLENGNTLIVEAEAGRVFEVTAGGEIVWEYINRLDNDHVGLVTEAERIPGAVAANVATSCTKTAKD